MYESSHYKKCGGESQKEAVSCAPIINLTLRSEVGIVAMLCLLHSIKMNNTVKISLQCCFKKSRLEAILCRQFQLSAKRTGVQRRTRTMMLAT